MVFRITPRALGNFAVTARNTLARVDHGIMLGGKLLHAVKDHIPDSKTARAASKASTSYAQIREKVMEGVK